MKIGILYTTFLRDELMYKTTQSIIKHRPNDSLIIADQGFIDNDKRRYYIEDICKKHNNALLELPFDCGLSRARNDLVVYAKMCSCDYVVITADSIAFTDNYDFEKIIEAMKTFDLDLVGFDLKDRIPWEFNLNLIKDEYFELSPIKPFNLGYDNILMTECEICRNFFIAKVDALLDVKWDNNLYLAEHEDFFWRFKQKGYKAACTNYVQGSYIFDKPNAYKKMRSRFGFYKQKLRAKYNLKGWVKTI